MEYQVLIGWACDKDDDPNNEEEGTWHLVAIYPWAMYEIEGLRPFQLLGYRQQEPLIYREVIASTELGEKNKR